MDTLLLPSVDKVRRFLGQPTLNILLSIRKGIIVGGFVRDYFLTGNFSKDIDIEIQRPPDLESILCKNKVGIERLPFDIFKIDTDLSQVTLSPPRWELYEGSGPFGHKDFRCTIDFNLPPEKSFRRRDLTINALGLAFNLNESEEFRLLDPFSGLKDLQAKKARRCSKDFIRDPVRFTRLIRFCLQFGLDLEDETQDSLKDFNLSYLTNYYFFHDALKVPFFKWTELFFHLVNEHGIALNEKIKQLEFLGNIRDKGLYSNTESVWRRLVSLKIPQKELDLFCQFAGISQKKYWS